MFHDDPRVRSAQDFANEMHLGQVRRSGEPYLIHVMRVFRRVQAAGFGEETQIAALLHDVPEDTAATMREIRRRFGHRVAFMVDGLSKETRDRAALEHPCRTLPACLPRFADRRFMLYLQKLRDYAGIELEILAAKMADQIDNLGDMAALTPEKRARKQLQARAYFLPVYEAYLRRASDPKMARLHVDLTALCVLEAEEKTGPDQPAVA